MPQSAPRTRRHDPGRRDRIIEATLDVIAELGVEGVTHRRVAERSDVPLGSMTYHFEGMEDLLGLAFTRFSDAVTVTYGQHLAPATTPHEARLGVVDFIFSPFWEERRNITLLMELYSAVSRSEAMRQRVKGWLNEGRILLERHFDTPTARALDGMIEGLTIHRSIDPDLITREQVATLVKRMAPDAY